MIFFSSERPKGDKGRFAVAVVLSPCTPCYVLIDKRTVFTVHCSWRPTDYGVWGFQLGKDHLWHCKHNFLSESLWSRTQSHLKMLTGDDWTFLLYLLPLYILGQLRHRFALSSKGIFTCPCRYACPCTLFLSLYCPPLVCSIQVWYFSVLQYLPLSLCPFQCEKQSPVSEIFWSQEYTLVVKAYWFYCWRCVGRILLIMLGMLRGTRILHI